MSARTTAHVTGGSGFTLIEMLVVIAVIVLLISILLPSLTMARENGWDVQCRSNMHRLSQVMLTSDETKSAGVYPDPSGWLGFVSRQGASALLRCPKDIVEGLEEHNSEGVPEDIYFVQSHPKQGIFFSALTDILRTGATEDDQLDLNPNIGKSWYPFSNRAREDNENCVVFDDDAACLITKMETAWKFQSIDAPGDTGCKSDHWLCHGPGLHDPENWKDDIKMRLTGKNHQNIVDPPYITGHAQSSYGMNVQIPARGAHSGQVLLVEYHRTRVHVDPEGNWVDDFMDTDEYLAPRHLDKRHRANTAFADGSVRAMLPDDLDPENQPEDRNIWTP